MRSTIFLSILNEAPFNEKKLSDLISFKSFIRVPHYTYIIFNETDISIV